MDCKNTGLWWGLELQIPPRFCRLIAKWGIMLDTGSLMMQRTRGAASLGVARAKGAAGAGGSKIQRLRQSGSAKVFLPKVHRATPEAVFLNTAGGLTSGDQISFEMEAGCDAGLLATTQTAERGYCALSGPAQVDVSVTAGAGALLAWVPQETILFDRADLIRTTHVEMAADATVVLAETLVFGRAAMGEQLLEVSLRDTRRVVRNGRMCWLEPQSVTPHTLRDGACYGGAAAVTTLALFAPGAADFTLPQDAYPDVEMAFSAWDGRAILRARSLDLWPLKRAIQDVLTAMTGCALPRVWQL